MSIFFPPKGAYGTTDEDFVLLSLRACLWWHVNPQGSVRGGGGKIVDDDSVNDLCLSVPP